MITANGLLEVGMKAKIIGGQNKGYRGTITHLYERGAMAGLVVLDETRVGEGVNVKPVVR